MASLWLPFTQMQQKKNFLKAISGKGSYLFLEDGRKVIDLVSSWWVNIHGHGQEKIAKAIYDQALTLEHVLFADLQHQPAFDLIQKLQRHLPQTLCRYFFSDDGSTAVEVALKMAFQYWKNKKEERKKYLVFEGSYHGDTLGAMSLGSRGIYTQPFRELLFDVLSLPFPATFEGDLFVEEKEEQALEMLEDLLKKEKGKIAAFFLEPLIQGASGMRICRSSFLQKMEKRIKEEGILLIYDEVMTGFGRTGEWFACLKSQTIPDLICLAKGLTGGFLPLALTVCTKEVFDHFCSDDPSCTFYHGHSYTANPLGCAAALASIHLLEQQDCFRTIETYHRQEETTWVAKSKVKHFRICGTIAAMDLEEKYGWKGAKKIQELALDRGVYLRPLGNVLYLMPPFCITREELATCYVVLDECLNKL